MEPRPVFFNWSLSNCNRGKSSSVWCGTFAQGERVFWNEKNFHAPYHQDGRSLDRLSLSLSLLHDNSQSIPVFFIQVFFLTWKGTWWLVAQEKANDKRKLQTNRPSLLLLCAQLPNNNQRERLPVGQQQNNKFRSYPDFSNVELCVCLCYIFFSSFVSFSQLMMAAVGRGMRRWRGKEGADECTREAERETL